MLPWREFLFFACHLPDYLLWQSFFWPLIFLENQNRRTSWSHRLVLWKAQYLARLANAECRTQAKQSLSSSGFLRRQSSLAISAAEFDPSSLLLTRWCTACSGSKGFFQLPEIVLNYNSSVCSDKFYMMKSTENFYWNDIFISIGIFQSDIIFFTGIRVQW